MLHLNTIIFVILSTILFHQITTITSTPIINGLDVTNIQVIPNNDFPFMVRVLTDGYFKKPNQKFEEGISTCGGIIITEKAILTAAHCLGETINHTPTVDVVAGITELKYEKSLRQFKKMTKFVIHSGYKLNNECYIVQDQNDYCTNDLAIIFLNTPLIINDRVKKANILNIGGLPKDGWIIGWGAISKDKKEETTMLQKAQMQVYSHENCRKLQNVINVTPDIFCVLSERRDTGTCEGDSGSPFISNDGVVYGILSYAFTIIKNRRHYCDPTRPSIYINLLRYSQWIKNTVEESLDLSLTDLLNSAPGIPSGKRFNPNDYYQQPSTSGKKYRGENYYDENLT